MASYFGKTFLSVNTFNPKLGEIWYCYFIITSMNIKPLFSSPKSIKKIVVMLKFHFHNQREREKKRSMNYEYR